MLAVCATTGTVLYSFASTAWLPTASLFTAVIETKDVHAKQESALSSDAVVFGVPVLPCSSCADWLDHETVVVSVLGHGVGVWNINPSTFNVSVASLINELDVCAVACCASSDDLALGSSSGGVSVWAATPPALRARLSVKDHRPVSSMRWWNGALAVAAGCRLSVWPAYTSAVVAHVLNACDDSITGLAWANQINTYVPHCA
jgi:hypothetical protein